MRRWSIAVLGSWAALTSGDRSPPGAIGSAPGVVVVVSSPVLEPGPEALSVRPGPPNDPVNHPPSIEAPARVAADERETLSVKIGVSDADADDVRLFALGLPPGARWDEDARTLHFRPDFIQGHATSVWPVTFVADDGQARAEATTLVQVHDTVQPPWPEVLRRERASGFERLFVSQRTDDFLDAPERAGRSFPAVVTRPRDLVPGQRRPVLVLLHGFLEQPRLTGSSDAFVISPADPHNTYWWGYRTEVSGTEQVPPYTQRRVLHLLEWVLRHEPAADPERVFIAGRSMGGAGAATLGLLAARHFAGVDAWLWQAIPRNHRPSRVAQLSALWGAPERGLGDGGADGISAWDRMDLTRALLRLPEARDQWLFSRHAKDDPVIHFGAAVDPSPRTGMSLYQALQRTGTGHLVVWDEGAHGSWDPRLGADWWDSGWDPKIDDTCALRRDRAFVGFSSASHDGQPGDGGNGTRPWDDEAGYAGAMIRVGDTGWNGDRAGALNRFLRWDTGGLVDQLQRFEVPLRALDEHRGPWPIRVDVTPRRVQSFGCRAGEVVDWRLGDVEGEAIADAHGELTIVGVPVTASWQTLTVTRR